MKVHNLTIASLALCSATALSTCNVETFQGILSAVDAASSASVVYATSIAEGRTSFDPSPAFTIAESLPELCAVKIEVQSSENSSYRFGVYLPSDWNGRMMTTGNGGFGGGINYPDMAHFSRYGFASVSTDTGHLSASPDGSWALNAPDSIIDWGWRAMHGSVKLAKEIVKSYYESPIKRSYYAGCSTGGRQGLKEMQISPSSFDGVLAGAPAWWTTHLQPFTTWLPLQNSPTDSPAHIPPSIFQTLAATINNQCDPQDGVPDNMTQTPFTCAIDWTNLNLTAPQISTLQQIYSPWTSPTTSSSPYPPNTALFGPFAPGTVPLLADPISPNPLGYTFFNYFIYNNTTWNISDFTLEDLARADAINPGNANADDFGAIGMFQQRGGKVMMYHGLSDPAIPVGSSIDYYEKTLRALKDDGEGEGVRDMDDFFRMFLVPNMGHCSGSAPDSESEAPWFFGGGSQRAGNASVGPEVVGLGQRGGAAGEGGKVKRIKVPGTAEEARVDAVLALVRWVEGPDEGEDKGKGGMAPDELVVRKFRGDNLTEAEVVRTAKLCKWPSVARWDGKGDVRDEASWSCES